VHAITPGAIIMMMYLIDCQLAMHWCGHAQGKVLCSSLLLYWTCISLCIGKDATAGAEHQIDVRSNRRNKEGAASCTLALAWSTSCPPSTSPHLSIWNSSSTRAACKACARSRCPCRQMNIMLPSLDSRGVCECESQTSLIDFQADIPQTLPDPQ
jgi:hypothetical protein